MKQNQYLILKGIAKCALKVTSVNVNTTCKSALHQPKMPTCAKKLRKF